MENADVETNCEAGDDAPEGKNVAVNIHNAADDDDDGELEDDASEVSDSVSNPASPESGAGGLKEQLIYTRLGSQQVSAEVGSVSDSGVPGYVHQSPNPDAEDGYFDDDDRSQTPLQDEPDAGLESSTSSVHDNADRDKGKAYESPRQRQFNENNGHSGCKAESGGFDDEASNACSDEGHGRQNQSVTNAVRKQSNRDDVGELDYDEEENPEECGDVPAAETENSEECGIEQQPVANQKAAKKEAKKREKPLKSVDSEKEEGEELEDGEEEEEEGEQHSTDGELDDDDDCEEGEIKEPGQKKPFVRPICRFYMRGNCTWGHSCRFLHPGVNDKGSYAMIDQPPFPLPGPPPPVLLGPPMVVGPGGRPLPPPWMHDVSRRVARGPVEMMPPPVVEPDVAQPAGSGAEASSESAWERGLRHAKEIRKKRKEHDESFDDKKEGSPKAGERSPSPLPAPARELPVHLPPPREAFFEEAVPVPIPPPVFEEGDFYGRPPLPPPPEIWAYRPPFDPFDPRWARGPPLDYPLPPYPFMPPPPDFRIPERDRGRRFSPPRFDMRRDARLPPWMDRLPPEGPVREPLGLPPGGGDAVPPIRSRGEEWKDPWQRSRSPKRKHSSSRSASRGRRRYRSRSYSSVSSSSYSSRSRSGSSSSYSSFSKSSYSRSSFSSRSSSASRSRSPSGRKKVPATTLGQSILEKRKSNSEVRRPHASEPLAIGSGPLPARAPPEKKAAVEKKSQQSTAVTEQPIPQKVAPQPVPPPVSMSAPKSADSQPTAVAGVKSAITLPGVPKLTQPIPLSSRAPLQPVSRGVSEVFGEQEELWNEPGATVRPSGKTLDIAALRETTLAGDMPGREMAPAMAADKTQYAGRPPGVSVDKEAAGGGKSLSSLPPRTVAERDVGLRPAGEKGDVVLQGSSGLPLGAKNATKPQGHRGRGDQRLEIGRNVMGRPVSSSSRSSSASSHRSLSSLSSKSSSERLYEGIASPISSVSSLSPMGSPKGPQKSVSSKPPKPSAQKGMPKTPPGQPYSPPPVKPDKPREVGLPREALHSRGAARDNTRPAQPRDDQRDLAAMHRAAPHRMPDGARQGSSRGLPPDMPVHEIRREAGPRDGTAVPRERDRSQHAPHGSSAQRRDSAGRHGPSGGSGVGPPHTSGSHAGDSTRVKSTSNSRTALPPPPKSQDSLSRPPDSRGIPESRAVSGSMKSDLRAPAKADKTVLPPQQPPSSSGNRKRPAAEHVVEAPMSKQMRHASDGRSPVKMPVPRKEKTAPIVSPPPRGRSETSRSAVTSSTSAVLKSPAPAASSVKPPSAGSVPTSAAGASAARPRKSTSSRREELLLQLKAVEDAIAKKRSKLQ